MASIIAGSISGLTAFAGSVVGCRNHQAAGLHYRTRIVSLLLARN